MSENLQINQLNKEIENLKQQIDFYSLFIENTFDWEVFRDAEGTIKYVNQAFENITGYSKTDLLSGNITEKNIVHPDDWENVQEHIKKSVQKETVVDLQFRIVTKQKEIRYINLCANPVFQQNKFIGIRTSARDITQQKDFLKLQEFNVILKKSEDRFKTYIESSPTSVFITNAEGKYTFVNKSACKLLNYSAAELLEKDIPSLLPPQELERSFNQFLKLKIDGESHNFETVLLRKDGSAVAIVLDGKKISDNEYIAFVKDISDRKEQDQKLKQQNDEYAALNEEYIASNEELNKAIVVATQTELQFRLLFENMEQGFALHEMIFDEKGNPVDYKFVLVNKAFEQVTGLEASHIVGKTVKEILPDLEQTWIENYGKVALTGKALHFENYSQEFEKYFNVIAYSPERNYFAVVFTDVTLNKIYQKELIAAKERAEESDKLKTAFLQNMSHEIRTPMNAIMGFSGMLGKPTLSPEKRQSFTKIIQSSSQQLLSIVNDILTISSIETKQEKLTIEKVCINDVLVELLAIFSAQSQNQNVSLFVKQQLSDRDSTVTTDKTKVTQILTNLLSNALKFTHAGQIEFGYTLDESESYLKFYVKDTGVGINRELQEKIFERFRQADITISKKYGGTGLGLSISKGFIQLLNGKIWVESEPNQGACFFFTIPYQPINESVVEDKLKKHPQHHSILIAEDEEYNYLFIEELLIETGYRLIHAKNGEEALSLFKENDSICLVLMDIKMPIMDGYTCTKLIKEQNSQIPVIAQSAYALAHEIKKYRDIFDDYITKPIQKEELFKKINQYIPIVIDN